MCKDNPILGLMQIFVPKKRKKNPGPPTGIMNVKKTIRPYNN